MPEIGSSGIVGGLGRKAQSYPELAERPGVPGIDVPAPLSSCQRFAF